jgi:hypothetical protein
MQLGKDSRSFDIIAQNGDFSEIVQTIPGFFLDAA